MEHGNSTNLVEALCFLSVFFLKMPIACSYNISGKLILITKNKIGRKWLIYFLIISFVSWSKATMAAHDRVTWQRRVSHPIPI